MIGIYHGSMGYGEFEGGTKTRKVLCPHNHISRKNSYLEKLISMTLVFLAKFDQFYGPISLKNENYHLKISSHNQFFKSSRSFTKYLY